MTDNDLRAEVEQLRRQMAGLTETVAALTMLVTGGPRPNVMGYDERNFYLNSPDPYDLLQSPASGAEPSGAHGLTPPRNPVDVLPRGGRNPRIGCEHFGESGTWIHGRPHDCPRWARR